MTILPDVALFQGCSFLKNFVEEVVIRQFQFHLVFIKKPIDLCQFCIALGMAQSWLTIYSR